MRKGQFLLFAIGIVALLMAMPTVGSAMAASPSEADGIGAHDPVSGRWYLRDADGVTTSFYYGNPGDIAFMGDWDCDGIDTPGLYRTVNTLAAPAGKVYLRNSNTQGNADVEYFFGNPGDLPLAGDWNGDGCDTISLYRPASRQVFVENSLGSNNVGIGAADFSFTFGGSGDFPFSGDFDGDGTTGVAVRNPDTGVGLLRQVASPTAADVPFIYGNTGDIPIAGDWDMNLSETVGIYRPSVGLFFLSNSSTGVADLEVPFGNPSWYPLAWTSAPDNERPVANPQSVFTIEDTPVAIVLSGTDADGGSLTFAIKSGPANGTLSGVAPSLTYTPGAGFTGADSFDFTVSDGFETSKTATVTITVDGGQEPPTAMDDAYGTDEDSAFTTGNVLDNDTDPNVADTLSVSALDITGTLGAVIDNTDGTFKYTPPASFNALGAGDVAIDTFGYTVSDGNGGSDDATVTITVTGANDAPTANPEGFLTSNVEILIVLEGATDLLANDTDPDTGDSLVVGAVQGSAANVGAATLTTEGATVIVSVDGSFTYDPSTSASALALAAGETLDDTFTYDASDSNGGTATATVTITLGGVPGGIYGITFNDLNGDGWGPEDVTEIIDGAGDGINALDLGTGQIAVDSSGNVFVPGFVSDNVFKIEPDGTKTQIIDATGDGLGNVLDGPHSVAVDASGNVYVSGRDSDNVFRITPGGVITQVMDATGDGLGNLLDKPLGLGFDASGNLYVAGGESDNVFMRTPVGVITEIIDETGAGIGESINQPQYFAFNGSTMYVTGSRSNNVLSYNAGVITEIIDETGDGVNALDFAAGIAIDASGNVFVSGRDSDNVFKITPAEVITQIVDGTGDGSRILDRPLGLATDAAGNVYVAGADSDNVFMVTGAVITEIADNAGGGTGAPLNQAATLAVSAVGDIYVAAGFSDNVFEIGTSPEPVMAGVEFTLTGGGLVAPLVTTSDVNGEFGFDDLAPGTYTLTETVPVGFVSTSGASMEIVLGAGELVVADPYQVTAGAGQIVVVSAQTHFGNAVI